MNIEEELEKVTKSVNFGKIAKKLLKKARNWIQRTQKQFIGTCKEIGNYYKCEAIKNCFLVQNDNEDLLAVLIQNAFHAKNPTRV